jgi:hypothetical protein
MLAETVGGAVAATELGSQAATINARRLTAASCIGPIAGFMIEDFLLSEQTPSTPASLVADLHPEVPVGSRSG